MRLLLQFPEGLKRYATEEAAKYEKEGHEVFISATPCWGACDLALDEAKKIKADKLVHYGHAQYHQVKDFDVEYKLFPITVDLSVFDQALPLLAPYRRIALVTTVSHIHQLPDMRKILEKVGHEVLTSKGGLAILEGQVLGCDSSAADKLSGQADAIVYFGGGEFHPLGIGSFGGGAKSGSPAPLKPTLAVSPYARSAYWLNPHIEKKRKQERGMLIAASQAQRVGILVSLKSGQYNLRTAEATKKRLESYGRTASILVTGEVDFHAVQDFNAFDAYVTTACPRLVDDAERLGKPVVNVAQLPELFSLIEDTAGEAPKAAAAKTR
ncbi:MAG: diphthamide biosynthesis enzyme Dph2 [Candidatus Micrarchaeota archaeon]|nr:diphthamide biosynthesis enzyme Dph2 [Candidatus Micrarchaeota archaeon]